jgi:hypothetical protein
MCFSAEASFGAGIILTGIGIASLIKARSAPQRVLACMPLFFAFQQFNEGILWLSLSHAAYAAWQQMSMYTFLVFAQVIWPLFVPFSVLLLEKKPVRKRILRVLLVTGTLIAAYLLYCLITYPVHATAAHHHIRYELSFPHAHKWYVDIFYFLATVGSLFVSGIKGLRLIGIAILLAYLIARIFYQQQVVSVWCYFAAIISVAVLAVIIRLRKTRTTA